MSYTADTLAALIRRHCETADELRLIASACSAVAADLDGCTYALVDAFDNAVDAPVRPWTDAERKAHTVSYYTELAAEARRGAV